MYLIIIVGYWMSDHMKRTYFSTNTNSPGLSENKYEQSHANSSEKSGLPVPAERREAIRLLINNFVRKRQLFFSREHTRTPYVKLDTHKCKACWKCINYCPNQVIGKVDLPWHKHALLIDGDKCTGCYKCVNVCQYNAYSKIDKSKQETEKQRNGIINSFIINNILLVSGVVMVLSGLILQLGFHIGEHSGKINAGHKVLSQSMQYEHIREINLSKTVYGLNYTDWSTAHKFAIVIFLILMMYHIYIHLKWYKGVVYKHLISRKVQVITLSVLFLLVTVTGLVPWFTDLLGSTTILRMVFIEIHDKLALIFVIYLILHIIKKRRWFITRQLIVLL